MVDLFKVNGVSRKRGVAVGGELKMSLIKCDPNQPRKVFDEDEIQSLANSIRLNGLIHPISVRQDSEGNYIIIAGERRYRACELLGKETISAIEIKVKEEDIGYLQMAENLNRADLKFYEIADFIALRIAAGDMQIDIAKRLGMSTTTVNMYSAWRKAPEWLKDYKERFDDIRVVYEFVRLAEKEPEKLQAFMAQLDSSKRLTRTTVRDFNASLSVEQSVISDNEDAAVPSAAPEVETGEQAGSDDSSATQSVTSDDEAVAVPSAAPEVETGEQAGGDDSSATQSVTSDDEAVAVPSAAPEVETGEQAGGDDSSATQSVTSDDEVVAAPTAAFETKTEEQTVGDEIAASPTVSSSDSDRLMSLLVSDGERDGKILVLVPINNTGLITLYFDDGSSKEVDLADTNIVVKGIEPNE